ncbi:MAG: hypothetical protein MUE44_35675 [Oscillatoriaceae cyanobacterium Prado104]|jgi:phage regulator Rha-like protein|nr:hypothetical protein [Oscillatoriaceae cyanobacterium Prado104]
MKFLRKSIAPIFVVICCCVLAVSCSESREVQCRKLTEAVNKGNTLIDSHKTINDLATTKKLAKHLNLTAKELENVKLTDSKLKEFQKQSVKSFREMSQAFGDIGKAREAGNRATTSIKGREQIQKALADHERAGKLAKRAAESQDAVTEQLINYCKGDR